MDGTYSAAITFTWNTTSPIAITQPTDQANTEGDSVSLSISATDSSSGTLKYSAVGLPIGLKINTSTGAISGSIAPGAAVNGPYTVTVTTSDSTYSASQTLTWTINNPIAITVPPVKSYSVGDSVSLQISATDSSSGTLAYLANNLPSGLSINPTSGAITGTIISSTGSIGEILSLIEVTDGTYIASQNIIWTIRAQNYGLWTNALAFNGKVPPNGSTAKEVRSPKKAEDPGDALLDQPLYTGAGKQPDPFSVKQGSYNDCPYIATIVGLALRRPEALQALDQRQRKWHVYCYILR